MLDGDAKIKYRKDEVFISFSNMRKAYTISTDKYQLIWKVDHDLLEIYDVKSNSFGTVNYIMSINKKFNMNEFATLENPNGAPAMLEIISTSKERINFQIDRIMNLKAFL